MAHNPNPDRDFGLVNSHPPVNGGQVHPRRVSTCRHVFRLQPGNRGFTEGLKRKIWNPLIITEWLCVQL